MPKLEEETSTLGGELLGFEIRELRFPLLDRRHGELADQEAKHKVSTSNILFIIFLFPSLPATLWAC